MPPKHHKETTEEDRNNQETGFKAIWEEYASALQDPEVTAYRSRDLILDDMLFKDLKYQDNERPNRKPGQDPHESIVREYILGDRLTGSQQLKEIRDSLRSTLLFPQESGDSEWTQERLQSLVTSWEDKHPGQAFMPTM